MSERRRRPRNRVYYGGTVTFNAGNATLACIVRNFSTSGAKIEFQNPALIPDEVEFTVARKDFGCRARLAWRDRYAAGLVFSDMREANGAVPLEWVRKLRASERINRQLQSRLDQLRSEY